MLNFFYQINHVLVIQTAQQLWIAAIHFAVIYFKKNIPLINVVLKNHINKKIDLHQVGSGCLSNSDCLNYNCVNNKCSNYIKLLLDIQIRNKNFKVDFFVKCLIIKLNLGISIKTHKLWEKAQNFKI